MNSAYREIAERIRHELDDLSHLIDRARDSWESRYRFRNQHNAHLDSVALNLHGFHSGLERLFQLIARHVDGSLPQGDTWHRDLLYQMAEEWDSIRPAVISDVTASSLDEFRRFRHLVRNVYTFNLVPERIEPLIDRLPELWPQLHAELSAFADFLEDVANNQAT